MAQAAPAWKKPALSPAEGPVLGRVQGRQVAQHRLFDGGAAHREPTSQHRCRGKVGSGLVSCELGFGYTQDPNPAVEKSYAVVSQLFER